MAQDEGRFRAVRLLKSGDFAVTNLYKRSVSRLRLKGTLLACRRLWVWRNVFRRCIILLSISETQKSLHVAQRRRIISGGVVPTLQLRVEKHSLGFRMRLLTATIFIVYKEDVLGSKKYIQTVFDEIILVSRPKMCKWTLNRYHHMRSCRCLLNWGTYFAGLCPDATTGCVRATRELYNYKEEVQRIYGTIKLGAGIFSRRAFFFQLHERKSPRDCERLAYFLSSVLRCKRVRQVPCTHIYNVWSALNSWTVLMKLWTTCACGWSKMIRWTRTDPEEMLHRKETGGRFWNCLDQSRLKVREYLRPR